MYYVTIVTYYIAWHTYILPVVTFLFLISMIKKFIKCLYNIGLNDNITIGLT